MTQKEFEANQAGYEAGYAAGQHISDAELNRVRKALQEIMQIISNVARVPLQGQMKEP